MNDAIRSMLDSYHCSTSDDYVNALREIIQELALLGLWRSKFFEHAAFYGGTALRILYGLDRYSEDLDFSLLAPNPEFTLKNYGDALRQEIGSFGFHVDFATKEKAKLTNIDSAFIKANTLKQMIQIEADSSQLAGIHQGQSLKIKLEVDIDPPGGFTTESRYQFRPIPYAVRVYCLPDLFAGKMHAVLCRKWKSRQKGRDWYDLVWYAGHHPQLNLNHLEIRMRQSGGYTGQASLSWETLQKMLNEAIEQVDIEQIRTDVTPFVRDQRQLELWSKEFFTQAIAKIKPEQGVPVLAFRGA